MSTITLVVDLAKSVFSVCAMDGAGHVLERREFKREGFALWLARGPKTLDQQARLSWHRVREGYKAESLAIGNRLRGLLAEFGIVMGKSDKALRRVLADLDAHSALPAEFKELIRRVDAHWTQVRTASTRAMHAPKPMRGMTSAACGCAPSSASAHSRRTP